MLLSQAANLHCIPLDLPKAVIDFEKEEVLMQRNKMVHLRHTLIQTWIYSFWPKYIWLAMLKTFWTFSSNNLNYLYWRGQLYYFLQISSSQEYARTYCSGSMKIKQHPFTGNP